MTKLVKNVCLTALLAVFLFLPQITQTKNLSIPFTTQAPYSNWQQPWQDFCEEATILMIDYYYAGQKLNKEIAYRELLKIQRLKINLLGWSLDENASKIIELVNNYFPWEAKIVDNPSLEDLKNELDNGHPVIIPAYGQALHNPHFQAGGPDYHTVILTGYDNVTEEFVTNDPGTRHGLDFRYSFATIMNAMHDFTWRGNTSNGPKVAIFTQKDLEASSNLDLDKDGLTKQAELDYGTILWLQDSDGDGYTDGEEVQKGFLPTLAENKLQSGSLIKTPDSTKVYLLDKQTKRHITNETVFLNHGWQWTDIKLISTAFVNILPSGESIYK